MTAELHGRLPWLRPDELDDEQREYYDRLLGSPRHREDYVDEQGRLHGAFNARLLDPAVGTAIQQMGAALRFSSKLPDRQREIVILTVAQSQRSDFEWHGHVGAARRVGLSDVQLDALRTGAPVPGLTAAEQAARQVTTALVHRRDLSDAEFAEAVGTVGAVALFDIVSLVGHYLHTALALRIWRVPLRSGDEPVFGRGDSEGAFTGE
jgi:alkylhydroperoxidase family enzyme